MHPIKYVLIFALFVGCAPARFVEPLQEKQWSIGGNLGGPLLQVGGVPLLTPLSAVEVGYGVRNHLTVHGGLHVTSVVFGNAHIDAGVTYRFLKQDQWIPNLSVNPGINFVMTTGAVHEWDARAKLWPTLDLNAYWNYGHRKNYMYLGVNNYFELSPTMALGQSQINPWVFSPQIGHVFKGRNHSWEFLAELKFLAPNVLNTNAFIPFRSILGKYGATGIYVGFRKIIGTKKIKK